MPILFTLFTNAGVLANGNSTSAGPIDLTGYKDFRLVLRLDGTANTKFTINELYGPAGAVAQLNVDIATGMIGPQGNLNYRGKFDVFGPKNFFIRLFNNGAVAFKVNGSLYATA
jgi:hypothetical protein